MPTFRHGKSTNFQITDSGAVNRDISDACRSVNFPRPIDMAETTAFGSTVKTFVPGIPNATFDVQGMFDATYDGYLAGLLGFTTASTFIYGPEGSTSGRIKYTGSCYLMSYNVSGSVSDMVSFSATFQISGAITRTTF